MEWVMDTATLMKLGLSGGLGAVIGLERELKRKPVGLKTSIVISIISCLLTIVSVESVYFYHKDTNVNITMDPLRLAAQIVSGIGFLGAGVILHRANDSISGLTTAAMIWGAAGIGIVVGAGFYAAALAGVIMILLAVEILPLILRFTGPSRLREKMLYIKLRTASHHHVQDIIRAVEQENISVKRIHILYDEKNHTHLLELTAGVYFKRRTTEVYYILSEIPNIQFVDVESA
ncbi:MgtC/SapB family protein [Domibacillus sp. A3M-37]|uniref:MgtC/SapB family protein n=1 Tax=Domibacillus sp. A3M-37 TaxID=2962037 RepID=UPI0020B6D4CF|nr:MgtC/SapB family protein [Domibacillus sp. A3M-37]MCP3760777.1 MgtC/SapB family protein [Domibacillus sp. A3M-37]